VRFKVSSITEQLTRMSKRELDEVIKEAKSLRQFAGADNVPQAAARLTAGADPHDYVLSTLCRVCRVHGIDVRGVSAVKQMSAYPTFRDNIPKVVKFIREFAPTRAHEQAVFRLIYEHMILEHRWTSAPGIAVLLSQTSQLPRVLDELFPGYYRAGLMPIAIKSL
jgi:hypothetical protein